MARFGLNSPTPPRTPAGKVGGRPKTAADSLSFESMGRKTNERQQPVAVRGPGGEPVLSGYEGVDITDDRASMILNRVLNDDPAERQSAIADFQSLPSEQKQVVALTLAKAFPNPRGVVGGSPLYQEVMDLLQGKPMDPARQAAVRAVAQAEGFPAGWKSEVRGDTARLEYNPDEITMTPESDLPEPVEDPGNPASWKGARRPSAVQGVDTGRVRDKLEGSRPYLRGPTESTTLEVVDGRRVPVRQLGDDGNYGPQDYPAVQQARKRDAAILRGDEEVPPAPYPVGDRQADSSLRTEEDSFTNKVLGAARGNDSLLDTMWSMMRPKSNKSMAPSDPSSGISTPEDFVAQSLRLMDPDARPTDTEIQGLVSAARNRWWSGNPKPVSVADAVIEDVKNLPNPTDFSLRNDPSSQDSDQFARNPLTAGRGPQRPKDLESWQRDARRKGPNADIGKVDRNLSQSVEDVGYKQIPGLSTPDSLEEIAGLQQQALKNSIRYAFQQGRIPYRDPKTGQIMSGVLNTNTTRDRLQFMLDNYPEDIIPRAQLEGDVGSKLPARPGEVQQRVFAPPPAGWTRDAQGALQPDFGNEPAPKREGDWFEVGPGHYVKNRMKDEQGFIDHPIGDEADSVLYDPNAQYDVEVVDDVPYLKEKAAATVGTKADVPVVGGQADPQQALKDLVRIIENPNAPEVDTARARAQYAQAKAVMNTISDPEHRAAYQQTVMGPLDAAAARRKAAASQPADDVASNLDASSTPIDDEPSVGLDDGTPFEVIIPEDAARNLDASSSPVSDPSVHSDSNTRPQSPAKPIEQEANANADAQKVASDAEADVADIKSKQDAVEPDAVKAADDVDDDTPITPAPTKPTSKPGMVASAVGAAGGAARNVGRNWLKYGLGGAGLYALKSMYDESLMAPIMADAAQGYGDEGYAPAENVQMMDPYSPEARIRRLQRTLNGGERVQLIPQTLSRPF